MFSAPIGWEDQLRGVFHDDEKWNATASQTILVPLVGVQSFSSRGCYHSSELFLNDLVPVWYNLCLPFLKMGFYLENL